LHFDIFWHYSRYWTNFPIYRFVLEDLNIAVWVLLSFGGGGSFIFRGYSCMKVNFSQNIANFVKIYVS